MNMKKLLIVSMMAMLMTACGNGKSNTDSAPNTTNVENVNGNIPDTTNSVSLESRTSQDTLKTGDSVRR
jgi:hypothetical protein